MVSMEFTLAPSDSGQVSVDGCSIVWAARGAVGAPVVVLVHGAGGRTWDGGMR